MTPGHDGDRGDPGGGGGGRALYAWEVEIFRRSREGSYSREDYGTVRAPSLLDAYTRSMEQALARARDPDDEWYGSEFAYPRGIARRIGERDAAVAAPRPDPAPTEGAPDPGAAGAPEGASDSGEPPDEEEPDLDSLADTYR